MRRLKALMAAMTVLIFVGLGLLGYGLVKLRAAPSGDTAFSLPPGSAVKMMTQYKDGLALYVSAKDGDFIYFYNPRKAAPEGRVALKK